MASMQKVNLTRRLVSRAVANRTSSSNHSASSNRKGGMVVRNKERQFDVFINHRGVDTKKTVAGLLYDRLSHHGLRAFMDNRTMKPGDKLYDSINAGILQCKVGIAIFSPRYCDSIFCLHELAMLVEGQKKLIPIFYDVKPSELQVKNVQSYPPEKLERFKKALQEAQHTVGLTFDSQRGDWSELISKTANIVLESLEDGNGY